MKDASLEGVGGGGGGGGGWGCDIGDTQKWACLSKVRQCLNFIPNSTRVVIDQYFMIKCAAFGFSLMKPVVLKMSVGLGKS
jgi:hypothetical protein